MIREIKIQSTNGLCESCGRSHGLQIHHLTYKTIGRESTQDLMTLCEECHTLTHELWKKMPNDFPIQLVRIMLRHFLLYCRKRINPKRFQQKSRERANHAFNKLPNVAKRFMKRSKNSFIKRHASVN